MHYINYFIIYSIIIFYTIDYFSKLYTNFNIILFYIFYILYCLIKKDNTIFIFHFNAYLFYYSYCIFTYSKITNKDIFIDVTLCIVTLYANY